MEEVIVILCGLEVFIVSGDGPDCADCGKLVDLNVVG